HAPWPRSTLVSAGRRRSRSRRLPSLRIGRRRTCRVGRTARGPAAIRTRLRTGPITFHRIRQLRRLRSQGVVLNETYRSPLLDWPGAVAADGVDTGIAWHYGEPLREQRSAVEGAGLIDGSHRDVLIVPGPDRLEWLHAIVSQHVANLADGESTESLVLSPNGHVEQHWVLTELGD